MTQAKHAVRTTPGKATCWVKPQVKLGTHYLSWAHLFSTVFTLELLWRISLFCTSQEPPRCHQKSCGKLTRIHGQHPRQDKWRWETNPGKNLEAWLHPEKPPQKSPMTWCKPSARPVRHSGVGITPPPSEDTSSRSTKTNVWRQVTDLQPSTAHDHWSTVTISNYLSVTSWGHLPRVNLSDPNWSRTKLQSTRQAKKTQDVLIGTTSKSVKM